MADWKRGIQYSRSRNALLLWVIGAIFISFFIAGLISAVAFSEFNPILFAAISLITFSGSYFLMLRVYGDAIQDPQEQYQRVVSQAPMGVAMLDTEMNYLAASEAWCARFGLEAETLVDKNHYEVFSELRQLPEWQQIYARGLQGESLSGK